MSIACGPWLYRVDSRELERVTDQTTLAETIVQDKRLPLISFTGSVPVGRRVAATVARRLGRTLLELGGNNGVIVMDDADPDLVVRAVLFGAVGTAGQIVDVMEHWFTHEAADGFNVKPAWLPGSLDDFVDMVVPELQRRGIYRTAYEGSTLRENLELPRPVSRYETRESRLVSST